MPFLFSYGTLQNEQVQIETFGRILKGVEDALPCYSLHFIEIKDTEVLRKSKQKYHPIIEFTNDVNDLVQGKLFEVSDDEIQKADSYEVDDYK
ncbi:MAG: gamma-glutamylcyclotransferase [Bacteroidetes bacterium]|nr:gamma-glutamylcyclotransferase [Bacteroidota bacterium]MBS1739749.1 gamma-glutamylcyclotransferase [Bacteroidota bacterium]